MPIRQADCLYYTYRSEDKVPYIYKIENQINGKIYIGKTSRTVEERWNEHIRDQKRFEDRPQYRALNKYGVESFRIEIIEEVDTDEMACERECHWISVYKSYGKNGYNATIGGDGKRWLDYDYIISVYQDSLTLKDVHEKTGADPSYVSIILKNEGVHVRNNKEIQTQMNGKAVDMFSKSGEYIRSFSSLHEAGRYQEENDLIKSSPKTVRYHISEVCRGIRKTAAGFMWKFSKDNTQPPFKG